MATGFVQRWLGKVALEVIFLNGQNLTGVETVSTDGTLGAARNSRFAPSSGAGVYNVPAPVTGADRNLFLISVSSGAKFKAAANTSFGVIGGSTMTVLTSTVPMTIGLTALSTTLWGIRGVWSTSTSVIPQPTYSTTT